MRRFALTLALLAASAADVAAGQQDQRWQVGVSSFASTGDYGTEETTRLVYTALSVRRTLPRGDVTLRVPWLDVRSDGDVVVFQDVPQPVPTRRGVRAAPVPVSEHRTTRESGPGDASITARYFMASDARRGSSADLTVRVELPTGDERRGLGLGAASVRMGVELSQEIGSRLIALGDASFTLAGRPDDMDVRNPWEYSVGLGAYIGRPVLVSVSYEQWRPLIPGTPAGRDLLAAATVAVGRVRLLASVQHPLSDLAPDFGAGAGIAVRF